MSITFEVLIMKDTKPIGSMDQTESKSLRLFFGRVADQIPLLLSGKNREGTVLTDALEPITLREILYRNVHNERDRMLLEMSNNVNLYAGDAIIFDPDGNEEAIIGHYSNPIVKELVDSISRESLDRDYIDVSGTPTKLYVDPDHYQVIKNERETLVIDPPFAERLSRHESKALETLLRNVTEEDADLTREYLTRSPRERPAVEFYLNFNSNNLKKTNPGLSPLSFEQGSEDRPPCLDFVSLDDYGFTFGVADSVPGDVENSILGNDYISASIKNRRTFYHDGTVWLPSRPVGSNPLGPVSRPYRD